MLRSQASSLPGHIQAVYVHNILKLATATLCKAEQDGDTESMNQVRHEFPIFFNYVNYDIARIRERLLYFADL